MTDWRADNSALDRVNGYEVESFMRQHGLDVASGSEGKIVQVQSWTPSGDKKRLNFGAVFNNPLANSLEFCRVTRDVNHAHQKREGYPEVFSPGLLQTAAAFWLTRKAVLELDPLGIYRFSDNVSTMRGAILTGQDYQMDGSVTRISEDCMNAQLKFRNFKGHAICRIERNLYRNAEEHSSLVSSQVPSVEDLVHSHQFKLDDGYNLNDFSKLIGMPTNSPQRTLLALCASSSVVCSAVNEGKLAVASGLTPFYVRQKISLDGNLGPSPHFEGINLELYLSDRQKFGVPNGEVRMSLVGRVDDGRPVYVSQSDLSFQEKSAMDEMYARAQKK